MRADEATLEAVAARLRSGAVEIEGVASPPRAPTAGACSGAVAAALSLITESMAGISKGLNGAADAVMEGNEAYQTTDGRAEIDLKRYGPK